MSVAEAQTCNLSGSFRGILAGCGPSGTDPVSVFSGISSRWGCCLQIEPRLREGHAKAEQLPSTYQLEL